MPIICSIETPNGAPVGFHKAKDATVDFASGSVLVRVASWPTEQAHNSGLGLVWMWNLGVPLSRLADIDAALCELEGSPFLTGSVVPDSSEGLDSARARKMAALKVAREAVFDAPLETPFGTFDSDAKGRDSLKEAVLLVGALDRMGMPSDIRYTLANNERITLTRNQVETVGLMLASKKQDAYDHYDALRELVDAATDLAAIEAIAW